MEGRLVKARPALSALQVDQLQEGKAAVLLEEVFKGYVLCKHLFICIKWKLGVQTGSISCTLLLGISLIFLTREVRFGEAYM